jgi:hypothetical protein
MKITCRFFYFVGLSCLPAIITLSGCATTPTVYAQKGTTLAKLRAAEAECVAAVKTEPTAPYKPDLSDVSGSVRSGAVAASTIASAKYAFEVEDVMMEVCMRGMQRFEKVRLTDEEAKMWPVDKSQIGRDRVQQMVIDRVNGKPARRAAQ